MINTKNRKTILMNQSKSDKHLHEGVARTIKAQFYKNSLANFIRQDGLGATAVMEFEI